jgi:gliding motility-associated-like protein
VQPLTPIVVGADSIGSDYVVFGWNAVPGAVGYEVSTDNVNWITPSSGPTGLTHRLSGLQPNATAVLYVRALGTIPCQNQSDTASAVTLSNLQVFIPNAFSPNGDGRNDIMQVYGTNIRTIRFMVFNQWGEKISESSNPANVWDGKHKGKLQPAGVYMYVCELYTMNGVKVIKKGAINLIR